MPSKSAEGRRLLSLRSCSTSMAMLMRRSSSSPATSKSSSGVVVRRWWGLRVGAVIEREVCEGSRVWVRHCNRQCMRAARIYTTTTTTRQ